MSLFLARTCTEPEWPSTLHLLYQHLPARERAIHVEELIRGGKGQGVSLDGMLGCWRNHQIVGAMLALSTAGHTVVAWPPRLARGLSPSDGDGVRKALLDALRQFAKEHQARIVQVLLGDEEAEEAKTLNDEGFFHLAHLIYLRRDLRADLGSLSADDLEFITYSPEAHADFLRVLERSYEQSLDCPRLTGLRAMDDIFESHRAQGTFDPDKWFLVRRKGEWVGCLLLAGLPEYGATEVAYLGVLPEARGQGIGRVLTRKALLEAKRSGSDQATLAVDANNIPARQLYAEEGFKEWDHRDAYLLVLDAAHQN